MEMLIICELELAFCWCSPNENDLVTNKCDIIVFPESR